MGFKEIEEEILVDTKRKRDTLNLAIEQLEHDLLEPPFVSDNDYEEIQLEAENDIVRWDLAEQEREKVSK